MMNDYKELIERLISASERKSNSLNTRSTCKDAADAIEQLLKERNAAVADFNQFAIYAASKAKFACKWCKSRKRDGRCQWFIDHKDDKICYGVHFEWRGVQEDNDEID